MHLGPVTSTVTIIQCSTVNSDRLAPTQAVQEALQAGDITSQQADAARERYAAIHRHFVQAMSKEKDLLDEAKLLNEELLVSATILIPQCHVHCMMTCGAHC